MHINYAAGRPSQKVTSFRLAKYVMNESNTVFLYLQNENKIMILTRYILHDNFHLMAFTREKNYITIIKANSNSTDVTII